MQQDDLPDHMAREEIRSGRLGRAGFVVGFAFLTMGAVFLAGVYSGYTRNFVARKILSFRNLTADAVVQLRSAALSDPVHYLEPARDDGSGVTVDTAPDRDGLILLTGFFDNANGLRLMTRDGTLLAAWKVAYSDYFAEATIPYSPKSDWNVDLHGSVILPDGSVIVNFEYYGAVKLDRCGQVAWKLPARTHHSIVQAESGGYWVPGRNTRLDYDPDIFPPFGQVMAGKPIQEDLILKVSDDGRIVRSMSVPEILYANDLGALLTANGTVISSRFVLPEGGELVHLNKIDELSSALAPKFPEFAAGDLLLSLRTHNLLFVVDPKDWRIKWYQVGPWQRQHDPRFAADGTIHLFNNNAFVYELDELERANPDKPAPSNIMAVDPRTGETRVLYGDGPGEAFSSVVRGVQEPTAGGGSLVVEFEAGRVFEIDRAGKVVWEYINRYDAEQVAEVTGAVLHPRSYFTVSDWSCPAN